MRITLPTYGELEFERPNDLDSSTGLVTKSTNEWSAVKVIEGIEIDFHFGCTESTTNQTNQDDVTWGVVGRYLRKIDGEINGMMQTSSAALEELHDSIFTEKFEQLGAYFLLEEIELIVSSHMEAHAMSVDPVYKFGFFLESKIDEMALLDPYAYYYAYFDGSGLLCRVSRE